MPELWLLCGRDPVLFRIPYYVDWSKGQATMKPAFPLRQWEKEAAAKILSLNGSPYHDQWLISKRRLSKIAEKTAGGEPHTYFAWNQPRPAEQKIVEGRPERAEFIDSLYQAGVGDSPGQLAYFWREFCHHAAHWMINKEKPVDMIFLRLHNCPLRANWKIIMTQRFPKLGLAIARRSGFERDTVLTKSGFKEGLLDLDMLAFERQTETCYRTVEVEHLKPWWKVVRRAERQRYGRDGYEYAKYFIDSVRRFIPSAIKLYTSWLAQISKPCVRDYEGGLTCRTRFVPDHLAGRLHPAAGRYRGLPIRVPNKLPQVRETRAEEHLSKTNGELSALLAVQPTVENVWECPKPRPKYEMDEPRHGKG